MVDPPTVVLVVLALVERYRPRRRPDVTLVVVTMNRFRLYSRARDELGEVEYAVPNWTVGDSLMTGDGRRFRLLRIVPVPDGSPYAALFVVEQIDV